MFDAQKFRNLLFIVFLSAFVGAVMVPAADVILRGTQVALKQLSAAPTSPASGAWKLYAKSDGIYQVDSSGSETNLSASSSSPAGTVVFYAGASAPSGWLEAYGQDVSRATYSDLFTAISTTYGSGDGSTTFTLPDCRGRMVAGEDDMGGSSANRLTGASGSVNGDTLGGTGGTETHTLTSSEMPSHNHYQRGGNNANHVQPGVAGSFSGRDWYSAAGDSTSKALVETMSTGGGGAHNNVPPVIIFKCIIKT